MSHADSHVAQVLQQLPVDWHEPVQALAVATLQSGQPLRLILVGSFSVGKSSMLNMLLQENILPTALEETTALPTFIEHGSMREMQLLGRDGSTLPLDESEFAHVTTHAPDGAACVVLKLPEPWLRGVSIIDLPGLGTVSATHREYTLAQIRQADALLYLIGPCGPSRTDLETLKLVHEAGKRVKVLITQWDVVEAAIARGEKAPSLQQWASEIEAGTCLRVQLTACHRGGLGREEMLGFVQCAQQEIDEIRLRRFRSELKPILQNALGQNAQSQRSCEASSEEASRALHLELMQRKQTLTELKAKLHDEQQTDCDRVSQSCASGVRQERQKLARELDGRMGQLAGDAGWQSFEQQGAEALRVAVVDTAKVLSGLSANYGDLSLPDAQVSELNLRLPAPQAVAVEDFLDMGKLTQLQQALESHQVELAAAQEKMSSLTVADLSDSEQALVELRQQRDAVAAQALPTITQRIDGGQGAAIGRMLGEVADIGLMFVNPAAAGAKVAALVGKGAKMANVAVNTAKVAKTVRNGVKVAKAAQLGQRSTIMPPPVIDKLGGLEMLSLGYWGERLGTLLGGGPSEIEVVDPQALAEQQAALIGLDAQAQDLRRRLARNETIASERQLTGWAMEQNQKEQARLQAELAQVQLRAEQRHRDAQKQLQQERNAQIWRQAERAVMHWLRSFDQQAEAMSELMRAHVRGHWENRVDAMVNERLADIDELTTQAQADADDKKAMLAHLREEAQGIERAIVALA